MRAVPTTSKLKNTIGAALVASTALAAPTQSHAFYFSFPNIIGYSPADTFLMLLLIEALLDPTVVQQKSKQDPFSRSPGAPFALASSETETTSAIFWAGQDVSRLFGLRRDERLAVGVSYREDWSRTQFSSALVPALGTQKTESHALGVNAVYTSKNWHWGSVVGLRWGDGRYTENGATGTASFNTNGFFAATELGYVVTLSGEGANKGGNPNWKRDVKKASLYIDPSLRASYSNNEVGSFVDPSNNRVGKQTERYVSLGGGVEIFALIPDRSVVYSPFAKLTLDQQVSYSYDAVNLVQNQTETFDHGRTYTKIEAGLNAYIGRNVMAGISGFRGVSSDRDDTGVKGTLLFNFGPPAR